MIPVSRFQKEELYTAIAEMQLCLNDFPHRQANSSRMMCISLTASFVSSADLPPTTLRDVPKYHYDHLPLAEFYSQWS